MTKPVDSLPEEKLAELKSEFDSALLSTKREGMEALLRWLSNETDYYVAPASATKHGAMRGGLIMHSLSVMRYLKNFVKPLGDEVREDSVIIASLLHDLCKANFYTVKKKNVKVAERVWEEQEYFAIEDRLPLGHGEKSAMLAMRHIELTDDELLAIRWHMGGYDDAARAYAGAQAQSAAFDKCKLAVALNVADMYVSHIVGI